MARTGTITLKKGIGKDSGKPYRALVLTVGDWSKIYFVDSRFELDYLEKYLTEPESDSEIQEKHDKSAGKI